MKSFYTSALIAGASPHGPPAYRSDGVERYSAAVLDLDGNSIEVVYHPEPTADDSTVVTGQSKVLRWNRHAVQDLGLEKGVGSDADYSGVATAAALAARKALMPAGYASSSLSQSQSGQEQTNAVSSSVVGSTLAPSLNRSLTDPIIKALTSGEDKVEMSSKTLVGTILGAAAGAAMAYAMCKSEEDSAKAELEHSRQLVTASTSRQNPTAPPAQAASEQPPPYGISNAEEYFPAAPSVKEYYSAAPSVKGRTEPPPQSERSETDYPRSAYHTAVSARTRADTEYYSVGSRSNASLQRSQTYPEPPRKRKGASRISSSTLEPQPEESEQGSSYQSYHSSKTHRSKTSSSAKSSSTIKGDARETSDSRLRTSRSTRSKGESRSREGSASPTSGRQFCQSRGVGAARRGVGRRIGRGVSERQYLASRRRAASQAVGAQQSIYDFHAKELASFEREKVVCSQRHQPETKLVRRRRDPGDQAGRNLRAGRRAERGQHGHSAHVQTQGEEGSRRDGGESAGARVRAKHGLEQRREADCKSLRMMFG